MHDAAIGNAFHGIVGTKLAQPSERRRALQQARLPVRLGGLGLTSQARIAAAACVGSWALIWRPMQQLCPQLFAGVELSTAPQQVYQELRRAHAQLSKDHAAISAAWSKWDKLTHDYDKAGESHHAFHPSGLAKTKELLPLARFGADDDFLKNAQRRWSSVSHHTEWRKLQVELQGCSRREAVRFVSVSQPGAGAFLNAVPKHAAFRLPTWALRIAIQRRLGLPLLAAASAAGEGRRSRHGRVFDSMGDCAANDGEAGHGTRHFLILNALYDAFRRVYGGQVRREPTDYREYSDHRPDLTLLLDGDLIVFDLKVFDPIGSTAAEAALRGGYVAFGNTAERALEVVLGWRQRGQAGDERFNRRTGGGYVAEKLGDYSRAVEMGVTVVPLLMETFGGCAPRLMEALLAAAEWRANKLTSSEYDETTWSARTWLSFVSQRISVAAQLAAAQEVAEALGLAVAADPRAQ